MRADHDNEPELFWALRGGGGNFGVVTALEFDLYPIPEVYAGMLFFALRARHRGAPRLARAGRATCPTRSPRSAGCSSSRRSTEVPEFVRGKSFAVVDGACLDGEAEGAELLRRCGRSGPAMDTVAMVPPAVLTETAHGPAAIRCRT